MHTMSDFIYGIDFGTSNSSIACFVNDEVRLCKNKEQSDVTPSAVLVGKLAAEWHFRQNAVFSDSVPYAIEL